MSREDDPAERPQVGRGRSAGTGESVLRDGLRGIALVTLATAGLAVAALLVTVVVSLLYR